MNLTLLKGLLNEIYSEIYINDFRQSNVNSGYKSTDIHDYKGFTNYKVVSDNPEIHAQVQQVVLIDPQPIMKAFQIRCAVSKYAVQDMQP